jgi:hypothetical protein
LHREAFPQDVRPDAGHARRQPGGELRGHPAPLAAGPPAGPEEGPGQHRRERSGDLGPVAQPVGPLVRVTEVALAEARVVLGARQALAAGVVGGVRVVLPDAGRVHVEDASPVDVADPRAGFVEARGQEGRREEPVARLEPPRGLVSPAADGEADEVEPGPLAGGRPPGVHLVEPAGAHPADHAGGHVPVLQRRRVELRSRRDGAGRPLEAPGVGQAVALGRQEPGRARLGGRRVVQADPAHPGAACQDVVRGEERRDPVLQRGIAAVGGDDDLVAVARQGLGVGPRPQVIDRVPPGVVQGHEYREDRPGPGGPDLGRLATRGGPHSRSLLIGDPSAESSPSANNCSLAAGCQDRARGLPIRTATGLHRRWLSRVARGLPSGIPRQG